MACLGAGCAPKTTIPVVRPTVEQAERVPTILVPGISGSALRDRRTGEILWGRGPEILGPRDGAYNLARPLGLPLDAPTALEATEVIDGLKLFGGVLRARVYGPIFETLQANGWTLGDLDAPSPDADLYGFAYDWRGDNVLTARVLLERLEALRAARGEEVLVVDLMCQSNGAHICRYLSKYGGADLEAAESGVAHPPESIRVRKMLLVGTSNGGSLRILREVHRGRRYVPFVGRKVQPETLFTFPAIFQDLPAYRPKPFIDENGRDLDIDLFDAATWERYGFSIFSEEARRRAGRRPDIFGTVDDRRQALTAFLDRAWRLHTVLARDVAPFDTRYYLLQNGYAPSPERAVLRRSGVGEWELLFTGDEELEEGSYLHFLVSSPGDGHATYDSQRRLSPQERNAIEDPVFLVEGGHFELIFDPATLRRIVEFLDEP